MTLIFEVKVLCRTEGQGLETRSDEFENKVGLLEDWVEQKMGRGTGVFYCLLIYTKV